MHIYHLRNLLTGGKKIAKMIWLVSVEMPDGKEDDEYDAGTTILDLDNVSSYTCIGISYKLESSLAGPL